MRARRLAAGLWLAALASACSLLVEEPAGELRCRLAEDAGDEEDPCPGDMRCIDGRCKAASDGGECVPAEEGEKCNGIDDDCDGDVDEGHDSDDDGVTWCGSGVMENADCDDFDPNTKPGKPELCDGRDNDCDGEVDEQDPDSERPLCSDDQVCVEQRCVAPSCVFEGTVSCPPGTRCDASGECVKGSGCTEESCGADEICDEESGTCIETGKANGVPCASDQECASDLCMDAAALRLEGEVARVCGQACCSDGNCGEGEFCFSSGTGARSCFPSSLDPRGDDAAEACTHLSGCGEQERCAMRDGMSVDGENFVRRADLETAVCGPPVGQGQTREVCTTDDQCASGICEFPLCSVPCGSSAECRDVFTSDAYYCRLQQSGFLSFDYVSSCVLVRDLEMPGGKQGDPCTAQDDCMEGGCVMSVESDEGFCAELCCKDSQCGEGTSCRPVAFGQRYEMRCVP